MAQQHRREIGIQTDNDSYLAKSSDRYYTNGLFIHYRLALEVDTQKHPLLANKVLGFEIGQKVFTPRITLITRPQFIDRPFAGYLYIGSNLNFLYGNESNLKLGARVGMIGPGSFGRQMQEAIHSILKLYKPTGWQFQIKDNFQVNLQVEYNRLLFRKGMFDMALNTYGELGTGFTGVGAGPMLRLGKINQLFNSAITQSTSIRKPHRTLQRHELFVYYKPVASYIAYDATIKGGLFNSKPADNEVVLTTKPLLFTNQIGIMYGGKRWVIDAGVVLQSRTTQEMQMSHKWGTISVLYRFN